MREDLISRIRYHLFYQIKDKLASQITNRVLSLPLDPSSNPDLYACKVYEEMQVLIDENFIHLMDDIASCRLSQVA